MFLRTSCISQSKTSRWAHMWLCAWQGRHYWWHIYNRKWFGALWTHSLKRLIDCGGWLTLVRRQPVSLTFSLNLWSLCVPCLKEGNRRYSFWRESRRWEARGLTLRCIISNAQKWCLTDDLKVFQLFRLMVKYEVCFVEEGGHCPYTGMVLITQKDSLWLGLNHSTCATFKLETFTCTLTSHLWNKE